MNELHGQMTVLNVPVPPTLEEVCGYSGQAHYLALYWGAGDEAYVDDGRVSSVGEGYAFLTFVQHRSVAPALRPYDLGSSEEEARHWLILDRESRQISIALATVARQLLRGQWGRPDKECVLVVSQEEWEQLILDVNASMQRVSMGQILTLMRAQQEQVLAMRAWLDDQQIPQGGGTNHATV